MSFTIYDKEKKILLNGGRAYDYVKNMSKEKLTEELKSFISWHGHLEMGALKPLDCSEQIEVLESELEYRRKEENK